MWLFEALRETALATFVRESPSLFGYTAFLSLHAMGLAIVVGLSSVVSLRLLGVAPALGLRPMRRLYPWMWFGLIVNALSGFGLFAAAATTLVTSGVFLVKMAFVTVAAVFMWLTGRYAFAPDAPDGSGTMPLRVRVLAATTLFLWFGAVVTGRLTGYPFLVRAYFGS